MLPKNKRKFTRKRRSKNAADSVKSYQEQKAAAKEKEEERHAANKELLNMSNQKREHDKKKEERAKRQAKLAMDSGAAGVGGVGANNNELEKQLQENKKLSTNDIKFKKKCADLK